MMRYEEMASFENLYQAHCKARKGKRGQKEVVEFELDLGWNLQKLRGELMSGRYYPKPYKQYRIYDPKERVIHALQYRDRIVQHTLCDNVVVPYMERHLIYDNAASRVGKGTHFAMDRLDSFLHKFYHKYGTQGYFLKFDVRKYYDSIDHVILKKLIEKAFMEDSRVVNLLNIFIDSYTLPGQKGLPLGNQTSQMFALYYLDGLDRMIKEKFRVKYYTRYMDDGILVHNDKNLLISYLDEMKKYLAEERELELNQKTQIIPISQGVDYLGFHFYMTGTGKVIRKLRASNKRRIKRKLKHFRHGYRAGVISREEIERSLASYRGHLSHGNTYLFQENLLEHLVLSKQTQKEREEIDEKTKQQINKNNFRGGGKSRFKSCISMILCAALIITVFSGISFTQSKIAEAEESTLSNPRIVTDSSMKAGQKVTWDCIWFGSYPQAEVVPAGSGYTALSEELLKEGDLIQDDALYQTLQSATGWDGQGDIVIGGEKYRRITKENATYTSTSSGYYRWESETEYHYFKYHPIKWRVLSVNGSEAFLLADKALDDKQYHTEYESVTWEGSTIRSWLNGYNASANIQNQDYSSDNFVNTAFGTSGQQAIKETYVENKDNLYYGTDGGNDTQDKIFLLSESETYTDAANGYGFVSRYDTYDEARRAGSSVYAKAMGTYSSTSASYVGNCYWWLRSPGNYSFYATEVDYDGWVYRYSNSVRNGSRGVRPALNLNLTASPDVASSNLWSYAGTVCSDGTVDETGGDVQGGYNSDGCLKLRNSCKVVKGQETFVWGTAYSDSYDKLKEVGDSLVWSSEDTSIAVVESGGYIMPSFKDEQELSMRAKVTGVAEGETDIYVEAQDGSLVGCHVIVTGSKNILFSDEKVSDSYGIVNYKKTKEGEIYYKAKALTGEYNNYIKTIQTNFKNDYQESKIPSNNYKSLRKYDESAGDRKTNQLITWDIIDTPDEVIDDTYEVLYNFLEKCLETGFSKKIIDLDVDVSQSPIEIEAKIVNKIYDEIRGSSESFTGKGKNGYTVQLKTVGIFKQSFGRLTVSGGKGKRIVSYNGTFCSDGKLVSQVMNQYIEDLSAQARKLYKEAAFSLWSDFRSVSLLGDISEYMLKDYLQDKADYLLQKGYGKLLTNLLKMKKGDELLKKISSVKNSESFLKVLQTLDIKEVYQEIKKIDYTDKEIKDASVKNAMERVESARKNMESTFFDYLYNDNTINDMNVIEKTKYYWKAIWQCPVDVAVYDENEELMGLISDSEGIVSYTDNIYMELSGDVKTVYLPKNQKVTFKLSGTDEGSMNYVIEEFEDGIAVARLNYYDVPLEKEIGYSQSVETNTLPDNTSVMPLVQENGDIIEADEYILGTDQTKNVNIIGTVEGEGIIYGDGEYAIGDAVELVAISSDTDYRFMGWYEGDILVGCDSVYRFTALEDVTVKALFEKIQKQISNYEVELSDKYKENARVVLYNNSENQANVVVSIYDAENVSDMDIAMKKYDVKGNLVDSSTVNAISDGAYRFIITDVLLNNWNILELFDMDNDLIAIVKYGQLDDEDPGQEELPTATPSTTAEPTEIPDSSPSPTPTTKPVYPYLPSVPSVPDTGSGSGSVTGSVTVPSSSQIPTSSPTVIPTVLPAETPGISPTPEPAIKPSEMPDVIKEPSATVKPSAVPDERKDKETSLADKLKKGSKVTDKKTKAVYKIIKTGKNKTVDYIKSIKKNPVSVNIPDVVKLKGKVYKVVSVGKGAFKNNKKLKTVKIGKNVQLVGKNAFLGCTGLKNVTMGKNIKTIGANAFNNCTALVIITIPAKVAKIGDKAFYKCKNLRYILVKSKKMEAKSIGNNAFGKGAVNLRVKTDKSKWKLYSKIFTAKGMSEKALYIIDPVKLVL